MANVFAKAAAKVPPTPKTAKKQTLWQLGDPNKGLGESISQLIELTGQVKALTTKQQTHKDRLKVFSEDRYLEHFAATGVEPDSPMQVANEAGQTVTFVVQDRATGYDVKDDMLEALEQVLGVDGAGEILHNQTIFGFDAVVMSQEVKDASGRLVQDVLGERLMGLLEELKVEGLLSDEQVDHLLTAKNIRTFKAGTLGRLADICGRHIPRMKAFLSAAGSAVVRYVKA